MQAITDLFNLREDAPGRFTAPNGKSGWFSIFGGQLIAQTLAAATATVRDGKLVHSLHAYFLRPGAFDVPIAMAVENERDGAAFCTRRVTATQNGKPVLSLTASFHAGETGPSHSSIQMPDAPDPETLPQLRDDNDAFRRDPNEPTPLTYLDARPIGGWTPLQPRIATPPSGMAWVRLRNTETTDAAMQRILLSYISDLFLVVTALQPHSGAAGKGAMVASLDHSLWFHQQPDPGEWLLAVMESPWADGGRALCRSNIFTRDGRLVASTMQEGLLRLGKPA